MPQTHRRVDGATSTRSGAPRGRAAPARSTADFARRFAEHFPTLHPLFVELYGERDDGLEQLAAVIAEAAASWSVRPPRAEGARRCRARRDPGWFLSNRMLGGVCYVDRFAGVLAGVRDSIPYFRELGLTYLHLMPLFESPEGNSDGGYAVSSYRRVNPALGTMDELAALAAELRAAGISLVVDFIFNHTSNEHEWARKAVAGEPGYEDFYLIFPDRTMPDAYEQTVREIFPDDHPGSFVQLPDGRWIWATFYSLPVGPQLREPRRLPRDGRRDALPREPGRRDAAHGCGGLHLEAARHAVASRCPRRTCCCARSTRCCGSPRRACSSSPRRSCTPTR